jgi:hypothetical protein
MDGLLSFSEKFILLDMVLETTLLLGEVPRDVADDVDGL